MKIKSSKWVKLSIGLAASLLFYLPLPLATFCDISWCGSEATSSWVRLLFLFATAMILLLSLLGGGFLGIICLIQLILKRRNNFIIFAAAACLIHFVASVTALKLSTDIRQNGVRQFALRSHQLITAIHKYSDTYGHPPEKLENLVPDYLPAVPPTGMSAYPKYIYFNSQSPTYKDNPWVLSVDFAEGPLDFSQLLFFPLQNYPEQGYGGWLEKIDDWALVHE